MVQKEDSRELLTAGEEVTGAMSFIADFHAVKQSKIALVTYDKHQELI